MLLWERTRCFLAIIVLSFVVCRIYNDLSHVCTFCSNLSMCVCGCLMDRDHQGLVVNIVALYKRKIARQARVFCLSTDLHVCMSACLLSGNSKVFYDVADAILTGVTTP